MCDLPHALFCDDRRDGSESQKRCKIAMMTPLKRNIGIVSQSRDGVAGRSRVSRAEASKAGAIAGLYG